MALFHLLQNTLAGVDPLKAWLILFVAAGLVAGVLTGYFKARKIQPNGFRWRVFRNEIGFTILNLTFSAFLLGGLTRFMQQHGFVKFNHAAAPLWVCGLEFLAYFFGFDSYFYWLHRLMHIEPIYTWVHKIHHRSISPNPLTTFSESPLESLINGGFVPLFTALVTVHSSTMLLITPFNVLMGLYVHSGHEFLPRWWNRSWLTKWFISATFHDQHHRFFKGNYGGYTTIWDRLCGTARPTFESDFTKVTNRPIERRRPGDSGLQPASSMSRVVT